MSYDLPNEREVEDYLNINQVLFSPYELLDLNRLQRENEID